MIKRIRIDDNKDFKVVRVVEPSEMIDCSWKYMTILGKIYEVKPTWRAGKGCKYWAMVEADLSRIEPQEYEDTYVYNDNARFDQGNYFETEIECQDAINRAFGSNNS